MDAIYNALNAFFNNFYVYDDIERISFCVFAGLYVLTAFLHIAVALSYQSKYALFSLSAKKGVPTKEAAKKFKNSFVQGILMDYLELGERGVGNIDTKMLVEKAMLKFNFFFWSFSGIKSFLSMFEKSALFLGAFAVFLFESKTFFGVSALAAFGLCALLGSFFNYEIGYTKFRDELIHFVNREMGKFYASDTINAITKLKLELKTIFKDSSATNDKLITEFAKTVTDKIDFATEKLWKNTEGSVERIAERVAEMSKPIGGWIETLNIAKEAQNKLNDSVASLSGVAERLSALFEKDGLFFKDFSEKLADNGAKLNGEITRLMSSVADLKETNVLSMTALETASADLKFVRENQNALENAVAGFEVTLQGITTNMGDAFAQSVNFNIRETLSGLADATRENINLITKANYEVIEHIEALFGKLTEQSKAQSSAILYLTESMDKN